MGIGTYSWSWTLNGKIVSAIVIERSNSVLLKLENMPSISKNVVITFSNSLVNIYACKTVLVLEKSLTIIKFKYRTKRRTISSKFEKERLIEILCGFFESFPELVECTNADNFFSEQILIKRKELYDADEPVFSLC